MNKKFVYEYLAKRDEALPRDIQSLLSAEIFELKKNSISRLPELIESAKRNFEKNGIKVHLVKDWKEAAQKIKELSGEAKTIVKSKSNTLDKLKLKELLSDRLHETDLGAYVVSKIGGDSDHPVLPAIDLTAIEMAEKLNAKTGEQYSKEAKALTDKLKLEIRKNIEAAEVGLTGANAVTADGQIMLLENEGNISLITRLPKIHIAVCGTIRPAVRRRLRRRDCRTAGHSRSSSDYARYFFRLA